MENNNGIIINTKNRLRTTRRAMWTVESRRGSGWSVVVDDMGPFVAPTRQDARHVAQEYRNIYPRTKFRIARLTPGPARKTT